MISHNRPSSRVLHLHAARRCFSRSWENRKLW